MRSGLDHRLAKLETVIRPVSRGRKFCFIVPVEEDHDAYLRDRCITLAPDDEVIWVELVAVTPQPRDRSAEFPK